jgi:hypothetical protein
VNTTHGAVLRVVVRIIGQEVPIGNAHPGGAGNRPELAKAQPPGRAFASDLDCSEKLDTLRGFTMAIGNDDTVPAAIVELENQALADRAADRVHAGSVAKNANRVRTLKGAMPSA